MWTCFLGGDGGRLGGLYLVAKLGQTGIDLHQAVLWNHPCLQRDTEIHLQVMDHHHHCIKGKGTGEAFRQGQGSSISLQLKAPGFPTGAKRTGQRNRIPQVIGKGWPWVCPGYCHTGGLSKLSCVLWNPGQALASACSALSIFQEVRLRWSRQEMEVTQVLPWSPGAADGASGLDTLAPLGQM